MRLSLGTIYRLPERMPGLQIKELDEEKESGCLIFRCFFIQNCEVGANFD